MIHPGAKFLLICVGEGIERMRQKKNTWRNKDGKRFRFTERHILNMTKLNFKNDIVNFLKTKTNLESSQRKITHTEKKHFQTVDFLSETMEVRRKWTSFKEEKKTISQESYIQRSTLQQLRRNQEYLR